MGLPLPHPQQPDTDEVSGSRGRQEDAVGQGIEQEELPESLRNFLLETRNLSIPLSFPTVQWMVFQSHFNRSLDYF